MIQPATRVGSALPGKPWECTENTHLTVTPQRGEGMGVFIHRFTSIMGGGPAQKMLIPWYFWPPTQWQSGHWSPEAALREGQAGAGNEKPQGYEWSG